MDINTLIYSECQNPVKIKLYNGVTRLYEIKDVPCGECYHCKITRINEWVTRMVIESNYHKYVYYGTLTYNGKHETIYNSECLAFISNFNKTNTYNSTPLILRKDHLQKFFKRLRKNTGIKIQYAACGEYGSTYGRPHFHYIIWSNKPIRKIDILAAWSAPRKDNPTKKAIIGTIEHRDIKNNPYPANNDKDNTAVFKYVAKYIQKKDFDFNKLPIIIQKQMYKTYKKDFDFIKEITYETYKLSHETEERILSVAKNVYLSERLDEYLKGKKVEDYDSFCKAFSPFFVCSKNPSLGFQYFKDNFDKFKDSDFKLYGLSGKYIFPLYFIRKTKETICPLKAQSEINANTTSYSRLGKMAAVLENIETAQRIAEDSNQIIKLFRCDNKYYWLESTERLPDIKCIYDGRDEQPTRAKHYAISREYLGFTDHSQHVEYVFFGDHYSLYSTTTGDYIDTITINQAKNIILYYYEKLLKQILIPLYGKSTLSANKKETLVKDYGGIEKFEIAKKLCLENLNRKIAERQKLYKLSKTFE